ncbi:MAG: threonine synthase, partial [Bacteroidia bacterium]|nr:threonine synthase [Bacteroidia bacterium]
YKLSSANSINIARLIPQSFYYMYAGTRKEYYGKRLLITIPSGNLGNLCAGIIAWKMGLPVRHFIAATNANDVLPRFLGSAEYEPRPAEQTLATAMDVGMPSNFPRLIEFFQRDFSKLINQVKSYSFDDFEIEEAIKEVYDETEYIMDPHTAVGYLGLKEYIFEYDCTDNGIFLSTAHPAKFSNIVEKHIFGKVPVPEQLQGLDASKKKSEKMSNKFEDFKFWFTKNY